MLGLAVLAVCAHFLVKTHDVRNKEYGEGTVLAMIHRLRAEAPSLSWVEQTPYTLSNYGPGFYAAGRAAGTLAGRPASLVPTRYVTLAATLACAAIIVVMTRRGTGEAALGVFAGLLFLTAPVVDGWVPAGRVDLLGVLASLAAYATLDRQPRRSVAAAALVALASLVKPTEALAALPLFVFLLARREPRSAVRFAIAVGAFGAAGWALAFWWSHGFYFWAVFRSNLPGFSIWRGYQQAYGFFASPIAVAGFVSLAYAVVASPSSVLDSPYPIGFAISTLAAAAMVCREGSNFNYFIEPAALASLVIGTGGLPLLTAINRRRTIEVAAVTAAIIAVPSVQDLRARLPLGTPAGYQTIAANVSAPSGSVVLADSRWFDAVMARGYRPIVNDPYLFRTLVDRHRMDAAPVIEALKAGAVPYVVLDTSLEGHRRFPPLLGPMWPLEILDVIEARYASVASEPGLYIYKPK